MDLLLLYLCQILYLNSFHFVINKNVVQPKHKNILNNVKFATYFGYSNHNQADISVHGHDMFSAYSMGSDISVHGHDMFSATVWDLTFQYMDMTCSVLQYGI